MKTIDGAALVGRRFESRVVLDVARPGTGGVRVRVQCDCGDVRDVYARRLLNGSAGRCIACEIAARVAAPRWDGRWDTLTPEEVERFWSYVSVRGPDECWFWTRFRNPNGYGRWTVRGFPVGAAGLALALTEKTQRLDGEVLHSCDNAPCCNPAHLRVDTHAANMREASERDRLPRGSERKNAILTEDVVRDIRRSAAAGRPTGELASLHGVCIATIRSVVRRETWRHV